MPPKKSLINNDKKNLMKIQSKEKLKKEKLD